MGSCIMSCSLHDVFKHLLGQVLAATRSPKAMKNHPMGLSGRLRLGTFTHISPGAIIRMLEVTL